MTSPPTDGATPAGDMGGASSAPAGLAPGWSAPAGGREAASIRADGGAAASIPAAADPAASTPAGVTGTGRPAHQVATPPRATLPRGHPLGSGCSDAPGTGSSTAGGAAEGAAR